MKEKREETDMQRWSREIKGIRKKLRDMMKDFKKREKEGERRKRKKQ